MAEPTLSQDWSDIFNRIGVKLGYTRETDPGTAIDPSSLSVWTTDEYYEIWELAKVGLAQFVTPPAVGGRIHVWNFLKPETTLTLFASVALDADNTVSATTVTTAAGTTCTASAAAFSPQDVGKTLTVCDDPVVDYTIASYTSPTVVVLSASSTHDAQTFLIDGNTVLSSESPAFLPAMPGRTITITAIDDFVIVGYHSTATIRVEGDATAVSDKTWSIAADGAYRMADDFGGIFGELTYEPDEGITVPIRQRAIGDVRYWLQREESTGQPRYYALTMVQATGARGQRWEMLVYPVLDSNRVVRFRYVPLFDVLSSTNPFPPGGAAHAETIAASCLAAAELHKNGARGEMWNYFVERLSASISLDKEMYEPKTLGVLTDRSDLIVHERRWPHITTGSTGYEAPS